MTSTLIIFIGDSPPPPGFPATLNWSSHVSNAYTVQVYPLRQPSLRHSQGPMNSPSLLLLHLPLSWLAVQCWSSLQSPANDTTNINVNVINYLGCSSITLPPRRLFLRVVLFLCITGFNLFNTWGFPCSIAALHISASRLIASSVNDPSIQFLKYSAEVIP